MAAQADSSAALVDQLDRSCGTPGFNLQQRVASFGGWAEADADALAQIVEILSTAFLARTALMGDVPGDDPEAFQDRMRNRMIERAAEPMDESRALRVLIHDSDPATSVAVESHDTGRFDMTICRLLLRDPAPEIIDEMIALFRLVPELNGPQFRNWGLGGGYPQGETTVQLNRNLSILTDTDGHPTALILSFTTQATTL